MNAANATAGRQAQVRPSPVFLVVVGAVGLGAWLCVTNQINNGVAVFIFVLAGWILSLIFHEFAHAFIAWKGGDYSIPAKGYLTLDPRRYTDPVTSIALPLLFLVIGGIGLPGGAVWINRAALRSRAIATTVSLAGPFTNLAFAAVCLLPLSWGIVDRASHPVLAPALAFLGFLQIIAFVLNMLPVPGLDGFGALEPYLPRPLLAAIAPLRRWGMLILFALLFYVPSVRDVFWSAIGGLLDSFGVDRSLASDGWRLFRFWA
ncbi:MAG: site-2 protease family protein [Actinomycetia bacterium]|nr:site-2 protease family protein [Actinomycetes bacterium]MCP4227703.1 site-2 protease family protein [Actinomycetes bacterium]MCP5034200.1 site-2 protease family protein [Actinomycetes bacterium]